jgi:hypothetical protein
LKSTVLPQAEAKGSTWPTLEATQPIFNARPFTKKMLKQDLKIQTRLHKLPKNYCLGKVRSVDHDFANKPRCIPV